MAAVGVHPFAAIHSEDLHLPEFGGMIDENLRYVKAIGEIGLDGKYTQDAKLKEIQKEVFRFLLALAEEKKLPAIVHSRQAVDETLEVLADFPRLRVLMHWYDGPKENLTLLNERSYLISIGPAILYSRRIGELAQTAASSMILTETDGPVRYRGLFGGDITKPSHVVEVTKKLAEVKRVSPDTMRASIFSNFHTFLNK
jgi:TatD DNase family protein